MKKLWDMLDILGVSILISAAVCGFANTGHWMELGVIPVVLWLFVRVWAERRQRERAEEEKEVWKTMYEMKADELLAMAETICRCESDVK